jgi:DNA-binding FadR family transcriptional regulator
MIEPVLVELVVGKASSVDLAQMERCLEQAEAAATLEEFEIHDTALHQAIVAATHNQLLISIYAEVAKLRRQTEWGTLKQRSMTPERRLAYQREHRLIVAALRERDPVQARAAMAAHLRHICRSMFEQ